MTRAISVGNMASYIARASRIRRAASRSGSDFRINCTTSPICSPRREIWRKYSANDRQRQQCEYHAKDLTKAIQSLERLAGLHWRQGPFPGPRKAAGKSGLLGLTGMRQMTGPPCGLAGVGSWHRPPTFTRGVCFRCALPTGKVGQAETDTKQHFAGSAVLAWSSSG